MKNVTINKKQRLYVLASNGGYSCLGFDVVLRKTTALMKELSLTYALGKPGSIKLYKQYLGVLDVAQSRYKATGIKSTAELIPEFIGREGWRVEVKTSYDTIERFIIGKSTGFIPCHLEIKKSNSSGGAQVMGYPFKSINFIEKVR